MIVYWAQHAMLPDGLAHDVQFWIEDGRFALIESGVPQGDAHLLPGLVVPGFANCHSHAFHRALRGRTHHGGGTFWTWRQAMYAVAERLDPDSYLRLATAAYAEMALAGITSVGEFHYLHHQAGGRRYDDPNAMGEALIQAAKDAGVRLTLLDTCYLNGGLTARGHTPLEGVQLRFGDGDLSRWAERVSNLWDDYETTKIGGAMHSVRAVPREQLREAPFITGQGLQLPSLHAHVSEQPAENEACQDFYGCSPTELLADVGLVDTRFTAVHATHLSDHDVALLAGGGSTACFCPTTERDLADGIGPARELADAGVTLSLGSDQHAVVDLIEEARALESHERLASGERGRFQPDALLRAATEHRTIGWEPHRELPDFFSGLPGDGVIRSGVVARSETSRPAERPEIDGAGQLRQGWKADLVAIQLDSPRTAGSDPAQALQAATAADVTDVIRDGERVVTEGQHRLGDVGRLLADAIAPLWEDR